MPATRKEWTQVKIKNSGVLIATVSNLPGQTFQTIPVPNYPTVDNHVDCGGTVQHYLSDARSGTAAKNDCPTGGGGSVVTYVVPAGAHMSTVSVAAANVLADADVAANKQAYANTYGTCQ